MDYQTLQQQADVLEHKAAQLRAQAQQAHTQTVHKGGIDKWLGYEFESSSGLTEPFALFSRQMKKELKKQLPGYDLISYNRGHFEYSAFLKNQTTGKLVYVSCSDVRYFPGGWYNDILVRTAKHDKDYTGGANNSTTLPELKQKADKLTA